MARGRNSDLVSSLEGDFIRQCAVKSWTPVINQPGPIAHTLSYANWCPIGPLIYLEMRVALTAAGTALTAITIGGFPVIPKQTGDHVIIGNGVFYDASGSLRYEVAIDATSVSTFSMIGYNGARFGFIPNIAIASGDVISMRALYLAS